MLAFRGLGVMYYTESIGNTCYSYENGGRMKITGIDICIYYVTKII